MNPRGSHPDVGRDLWCIPGAHPDAPKPMEFPGIQDLPPSWMNLGLIPKLMQWILLEFWNPTFATFGKPSCVLNLRFPFHGILGSWDLSFHGSQPHFQPVWEFFPLELYILWKGWMPWNESRELSISWDSEGNCWKIPIWGIFSSWLYP